MSHVCIAKDAQSYRKMAIEITDGDLLTAVNSWKEFQRPMYENNFIWRVFCGIYRREAHSRGLTPLRHTWKEGIS